MNNEYWKEYKCCKHIYSSLVLETFGLKFCPEVGNSFDVLPYINLSSIEDNEKRRQEIIENFKNDKMPDKCAKCSLLYRQFWEHEYQDVSEIYKLTIFNWRHCNAKCFYCSVNSRFDEKVKKSEFYDALPIVEKLIQEGRLTSNSYVDFQGGEPTMLEEFPQILDLVLKNKCKIQVLTNAIKYEPIISKMLCEGTAENWICISIDCGSSSTYKKIKGVNEFDNVIANVEKYIEEAGEKRSNVRIKYIILNNFNDNKKEIDSFIELCKKINVNTVSRTVDHREHLNKDQSIVAACRLLLSYNYLGKRLSKNNINIYHEYWADEHIEKTKQKIMKKYIFVYLIEKLKFYFK